MGLGTQVETRVSYFGEVVVVGGWTFGSLLTVLRVGKGRGGRVQGPEGRNQETGAQKSLGVGFR